MMLLQLVLLTNYFPAVMAVVFLVFLYFAKIPNKRRFFLRELLALCIAVLLAHVNRLFGLWPAHLNFPSGHMTFCLGAALSLGLLRPWTLLITLPILIPFGRALVVLGFHKSWDVWCAIPLVLVVYGIVHRLWRIPPAGSGTV